MRPTRWAVAAICATTMLASGCTRAVDGDPVASPGEAGKPFAANSACNRTSTPMFDVKSSSDTEPKVQVPHPPGWNQFESAQTPVLRLVVKAEGLTANGFIPNFNVIIDDLGGKIDNVDSAYAFERSSLDTLNPTDVTETSGTVCGFPSHTIQYTAGLGSIAPHPITCLFVGVQSGGKVYAVLLTIQSANPDDPIYVADRKTIIDGIQIAVPAL